MTYVICHVSCVMCHVACGMWHVSCVMWHVAYVFVSHSASRLQSQGKAEDADEEAGRRLGDHDRRVDVDHGSVEGPRDVDLDQPVGQEGTDLVHRLVAAAEHLAQAGDRPEQGL